MQKTLVDSPPERPWRRARCWGSMRDSRFIKQTEIATSELIGDHLAGESQVPVPLFGEERQVVVFIRGNHVQ